MGGPRLQVGLLLDRNTVPACPPWAQRFTCVQVLQQGSKGHGVDL